MKYRIKWETSSGAFAVPDTVTDKAIKLAPDKAIKVLLYLLKHKDLPQNPSKIGVSEDDMEDALYYWEQMGVVCKDDRAVEGAEKLPSANKVQQSETQEAKTDIIQTEEKIVAPEKPIYKNTANNTDTMVTRRQPKAILPSEIEKRFNESQEVKLVFKSAEEALARPINFTEQRTLLAAIDYYNLPAHVVVMIIGYAVSIGKSSMNFIESMVKDWNAKSINTIELAERELLRIQKHNTLESSVIETLEIDRKLTTKEKEYITQWSDMDISIDLILHSYNKSIPQTGKLSFAYMNKILSTWYDNGVRTINDADSLDSKALSRTAKKVSPKVTTMYKTDEQNAPSYDLDLIFQHAMDNVPKVVNITK